MALKQKPLLVLGAVLGAGLIGWTLLAPQVASQNNAHTSASNDVRDENGMQVIHIMAQRGYTPRQVTAQAGKPSRLEIETNNTYDCSSAVRIPSLNYSGFLPPTGKTSIDVPPQEKGTTLNGLCSMGMYRFEVTFN